MDYGCNGSDTYSANARKSFVSDFKYSASDLVDVDLNIIKRNIDDNKPVYMKGCRESKTRAVTVEKVRYKKLLWWKIKRIRYTETHYEPYYTNCHAWAADGYLDEGGKSLTLHMNWGYGGDNGWFDYEDIDSN